MLWPCLLSFYAGGALTVPVSYMALRNHRAIEPIPLVFVVCCALAWPLVVVLGLVAIRKGQLV